MVDCRYCRSYLRTNMSGNFVIQLLNFRDSTRPLKKSVVRRPLIFLRGSSEILRLSIRLIYRQYCVAEIPLGKKYPHYFRTQGSAARRLSRIDYLCVEKILREDCVFLYQRCGESDEWYRWGVCSAQIYQYYPITNIAYIAMQWRDFQAGGLHKIDSRNREKHQI